MEANLGNAEIEFIEDFKESNSIVRNVLCAVPPPPVRSLTLDAILVNDNQNVQARFWFEELDKHPVTVQHKIKD